MDESGINEYLHRAYGRSVKGKKVLGEASGNRFVRESFIAGLTQGKLTAPMCFQGTCDTQLFNAWLRNFLLPKLRPGQALILDNATFHKSAETKKILESAQCRLLFLPPYSPDLNPIEKCWAVLKAKISNIAPFFSRFQDAVHKAILSMSI